MLFSALLGWVSRREQVTAPLVEGSGAGRPQGVVLKVIKTMTCGHRLLVRTLVSTPGPGL